MARSTKKVSQDAAKDESRADALETFLNHMAKERPNEVLRLDDPGAKVNIETVPTGAISLDVAIGAGGFPKGKVIELFGGEGGGKCLVKGTYVWSDAGLETIEELFARCGQKASNTTRVTDITHLGVRAVNENGELEQVAALTHNYTRATWRVTVESGRHVEATANHPLRVLSSSGFIEWRNVADLEVGDVLVSARFGAAQAGGTSELDEDEALFLGYLVADGSLRDRYQVNFANWDPEIRFEYQRVAAAVTGREQTTFGQDVRTLLHERYGLDCTNADGKSVPHCVRTAGVKMQALFLSALYEGDGWVDDNKIGLTVASRTLAEQVQLLLLGMGIPATLTPKWNSQYGRNYWNVLVSQSVSARFLDLVGFRSQRRAAQVAERSRTTTSEAWVEDLPNITGLIMSLGRAVGGDREFAALTGDLRRDDLNLTRRIDCSRGRLGRIIAWAESKGPLNASARHLVEHLRDLAATEYTFERVVSVEDAGEQPTFDLFVPGTSSFVANGIVSHNTTVALTVAANCQKQGGTVGFIDAEHGLNRRLCENIGIDPKHFVVFQPNNGEEAIDMVDQMIRSGAFDMVIVDSVAAMTPKAEIDAEVEQQFMGLHARLMSKFMRRVAGVASENNVMLVLINQVRKNLQAYGTPDETTGGKAIKFYASLRIEVRTSGSKKITRGNEVVGHTVVATVKKNRLGPPHTTAEFDLIYGEGVDGSGAILDVAEKLGVLTRAGAYYTEIATGERLSELDEHGRARVVVGKEAAKALLRRDDSLRERIVKAIYDALGADPSLVVSTMSDDGTGAEDE